MFQRLFSASLGSSVGGSLTLTTEQSERTHERQITAEFANCSAYLFTYYYYFFFFTARGTTYLFSKNHDSHGAPGDHPRTGGESFLSSLSYNCTIYSIYWTSLRRPAALSLYVSAPSFYILSCFTAYCFWSASRLYHPPYIGRASTRNHFSLISSLFLCFSFISSSWVILLYLLNI